MYRFRPDKLLGLAETLHEAIAERGQNDRADDRRKHRNNSHEHVNAIGRDALSHVRDGRRDGCGTTLQL